MPPTPRWPPISTSRRDDGEAASAAPFSESELRPRLERWFHDQ